MLLSAWGSAMCDIITCGGAMELPPPYFLHFFYLLNWYFVLLPIFLLMNVFLILTYDTYLIIHLFSNTSNISTLASKSRTICNFLCRSAVAILKQYKLRWNIFKSLTFWVLLNTNISIFVIWILYKFQMNQYPWIPSTALP